MECCSISGVLSAFGLSLQFIQADLDSMIREIVDEMSVIHGDRFILESKGALLGNWGCDGLRHAVEVRLMQN